MYLPKWLVSSWLLVSSKKQTVLTNSDERITNNQKGFAVIPLVILMLFGIAAGVLLIQNGTSFLPKAAAPPNDGRFRIVYAQSCDDSGDYRSYSIYQGSNVFTSGTTTCPMGNYRPCGDFMKLFCGERGLTCYVGSSYEGICLESETAPSNTTISTCTLEETKSLQVSHCDSKSDGRKIIGNTSCRNTENPSNYTYYCYRSTQSQAQPPAPAAQPDMTSTLKQCTYPDIIDRGAIFSHCDTNSEKHIEDKGKCNRLAIQGNGFTLFCKQDGSAPAAQPASQTTLEFREECEQTLKDKCKTEYPKSIGCYKVDKGIKCVFPPEPNTDFCLTKDTNFCKDPSDGDPREGCETKDANIIKSDGSKTPVKYTRCTPAKAGAPTTATAPRAPAPATGGPTKIAPLPAPEAAPRGAQSQGAVPGTATAPQPVSTSLTCGKDKDGLDIPCYSIGVFSPTELTNREAQAKIASVNYAQFRDILTREQERIGAEIKANAEKKIAEAEAALKACMQ